MKEIKLTRGHVAIVDDEDYDRLMQWKWHATGTGVSMYAYKHFRRDGKVLAVAMHRHVIDAPKGKNVDHINRNTFDNRKENLRLCTHAENLRNQMRRTAQYKGIALKNGRWNVHIMVDGVAHNLGSFRGQVAAAKEYDKLAKLLHGEFACLNFPENGDSKINVINPQQI